MFIKVLDEFTGPNIVWDPDRVYQSRQEKEFDDDKSEDAIEEDEEDLSESPSFSYKRRGTLNITDTEGNTREILANPRFDSYRDMFNDLLRTSSRITLYPIL